MLDANSFKLLEKFAEYLSSKPDLSGVLRYLVQYLCQEGHTCGVTLAVMNQKGLISSVEHHGDYPDRFKNLLIHIDSDSPAALSLKNQKMLILDLENLPYANNEFLEDLKDSPYKSGCVFPLTDKTILILTFINNYEITISRDAFLECFKSLLKMFISFQNKNYINECELLNFLTERQELICEEILKGKTNLQIAEEMAYSVSLIRQETMRIYAKMDVDGRSELKKKLADQIESDANQDQ